MIVADDLSGPQKAVQGMHAILESTKAGLIQGPHPNLVFCKVPDSDALRRWSQKLQARDIDFRTFVEPDLDDKLTAIATRCVSGSERKLFSNLPLVR